MKKKFKKLSLTTETLGHLNEAGLDQVAGGATITAQCSGCTATCSYCTIHCTICCP
ncbi:MAG TPA: class I lanthipeptide [Thermoanaerobaculia bacterium]|jgi:natural product precursor